MQLNLAFSMLLPAIAPNALSTLEPTPAMEQLQTLTRKIQLKVPGSRLHRKAWTTWCVQAIDCIKEELSLNLPHPVDDVTTETLAFQLGVAADVGERPSFTNAGSRSGYAMDFFCRARRLADMFVCVGDRFPEFYALQINLLLHRSEVCRIVSIGGGPGYDFCALALAKAFTGSNCAIEGTVYDFEEGWSDMVDAMSISTTHILQQTHPFELSTISCHFGGKCDITKSLSDPSNTSLLVFPADIIVCQYCVAENANLLRESDFIFFRDLFKHAKQGAIIILTETTHRLWPEFVDLVLDMDFEVSFVRGRGTQLVLRKQIGCHHLRPGADEIDQMKEDAHDHELTMESGHSRQRRKIPET